MGRTEVVPSPELPVQLVLETERLILRRFTFDDIDFIIRLLNEPAFLEFIGDKGVRDAESAREYLRQGPMESYKQFGFGMYLVQTKEDESPVGMCGLIKREALDDVDVGFAFSADHRRKGYAFEAASAVLNLAYNDLGIERVVAVVSPGNEASVGMLKKLGFVLGKMVSLAAGDECQLFVPGADFRLRIDQ